MKTKELLQINPNRLKRLDRATLAKITSRLAQTAKKRVQRLQDLEKSENITISKIAGWRRRNYEKLSFSVKNKSKDELISQFKKLKDFLGIKTTKKRSIVKQAQFLESSFKEATKEEYDLVMKMYREAVELNAFAERYKYDVQDYIKSEIQAGTIDENIHERISAKITEWYENDKINGNFSTKKTSVYSYRRSK